MALEKVVFSYSNLDPVRWSFHFLSDPGLLVRSMCPDCLSQTTTPSVNLTYVTLADKDTNPILTDNANRAFQGNVATQVNQPGLMQLW